MVQTSPTVLTELAVTSLSISGVDVVTALLVAEGQVADLNGEKLVIDADADTYIQQTGGAAGTDDSFDIVVAGAADFRVAANVLHALSGSSIATNTIAEETAASGVTIDGVLLKDSQVTTDVILEKTAAAGVTADGVLLKDGTTNARSLSQDLTASGAITVGRNGVVTLAHSTVVIAATLAAPTAGDELLIVNTSLLGTVAHTVTLPAGVTFDGTNNTATLDAPEEALFMKALSPTRWKIITNIGSVGLSIV